MVFLFHLKEQVFKDIAEIQVDCCGAGQHHGMGVSAMPPAVVEVLGHLYKLQRRHSPENFDWDHLCAVPLDLKST
jgi:hypothetical protein